MIKFFKKHKSQKAFSLIELLVCAFLSIVIIALLCQTVLINNRLYKTDTIRTHLNQDLKNAMTILTASIKSAGENLTNFFPAVELRKDKIQGTSRLIIRRGLLTEVLKLCEEIEEGDSLSRIPFATAGTTYGCIHANNLHNYETWKNFRMESPDTLYPYIYDQREGKGEFFPYIDEQDTGNELYLITNNHEFVNDYDLHTSAMYMIEEWQFLVQDGFLVLIENGNINNPKKIINNVSKFNVTIKTIDGETYDTFLPEYSDIWTEIEAINVSIENEKAFLKDSIKKNLNASFYPRNILSR